MIGNHTWPHFLCLRIDSEQIANLVKAEFFVSESRPDRSPSHPPHVFIIGAL